MKLLIQYLRSRAASILLFVLFAGIMAFSFSLYHLPVRAVLYPAVLCALLGRWPSVSSARCVCIS